VTSQVLEWFVSYGASALFFTLLLAAIGIPLPSSLLLIAAGSFIEQGEMGLWQVFVFGCTGVIVGDQIGYGLGRWGGRRLLQRFAKHLGGEDKLKQTEVFSRRWGGPGIFFSRWLVTPLGPWLNLTSGVTAYPWKYFLVWDVLGEITWVALYLTLGYLFSDRVQYFASLLGNLMGVCLGLIASLLLGWQVIHYFRNTDAL
jgi:membrane-associated protein